MTKYYTDCWQYSVLAGIVTIVSVFAAWSLEQGIMAAFLAGYTFDSFLNRESTAGTPVELGNTRGLQPTEKPKVFSMPSAKMFQIKEYNNVR